MKPFKIYANAKRSFTIIAATFPRLVTLLFNNINTIKIISSLKAKLLSKVTIKTQYLFSVVANRVKLRMLMANKVTPIKTNLIVSFKSIVSNLVTITMTSNIIASMKMLVKATTTIPVMLKITAQPLVGRFRLLGGLDPKTLGEMDGSTLGDLDFIMS